MSLADEVTELSCPGCDTLNNVTLKHIIREEKVRCVGCNKEIQLTDKNGRTRKGVDAADKARKELAEIIKDINKSLL